MYVIYIFFYLLIYLCVYLFIFIYLYLCYYLYNEGLKISHWQEHAFQVSFSYRLDSLQSEYFQTVVAFAATAASGPRFSSA